MPDQNGRPTKPDFEAFAQENGLRIVGNGYTIQPGDKYIAGRNMGIKLFECESVDPRQWINPKGPIHYPYDTWECWKVERV